MTQRVMFKMEPSIYPYSVMCQPLFKSSVSISCYSTGDFIENVLHRCCFFLSLCISRVPQKKKKKATDSWKFLHMWFLCCSPPGPPFIVSPPGNITVNISQDAFFTCQAEAYPRNLTYTWFWEEDNVFFKK